MDTNWTPLPGHSHKGEQGLRCTTDVGVYEVYPWPNAWGGMGWRWSVSIHEFECHKSDGSFSTREGAIKGAEEDYFARKIAEQVVAPVKEPEQPQPQPEKQVSSREKQRQNFSELVGILTGAGG